MRGFLFGIVFTLIVLVGTGLLAVTNGWIPVNADGGYLPFERWAASRALNAERAAPDTTDERESHRRDKVVRPELRSLPRRGRWEADDHLQRVVPARTPARRTRRRRRPRGRNLLEDRPRHSLDRDAELREDAERPANLAAHPLPQAHGRSPGRRARRVEERQEYRLETAEDRTKARRLMAENGKGRFYEMQTEDHQEEQGLRPGDRGGV